MRARAVSASSRAPLPETPGRIRTPTLRSEGRSRRALETRGKSLTACRREADSKPRYRSGLLHFCLPSPPSLAGRLEVDRQAKRISGRPVSGVDPGDRAGLGRNRPRCRRRSREPRSSQRRSHRYWRSPNPLRLRGAWRSARREFTQGLGPDMELAARLEFMRGYLLRSDLHIARSGARSQSCYGGGFADEVPAICVHPRMAAASS
jgi:hypothetical protein